MNNPGQTILLVSLFLMNAAGFLVMFSDKEKARHGHWRIPERTLLLIAILGGQPGLPLRNVLFPAQNQTPQIHHRHPVNFGVPNWDCCVTPASFHEITQGKTPCPLSISPH